MPLWFGGERMHPRLLRRIVRWGSGFNPLVSPSPADLDVLHDGLRAAGRDPAGLEMVGGLRGRFPRPTRSPIWKKRWLACRFSRGGLRDHLLQAVDDIDDARELGPFRRRWSLGSLRVADEASCGCPVGYARAYPTGHPHTSTIGGSPRVRRVGCVRRIGRVGRVRAGGRVAVQPGKPDAAGQLGSVHDHDRLAVIRYGNSVTITMFTSQLSDNSKKRAPAL